jgi:hypothetical protein
MLMMVEADCRSLMALHGIPLSIFASRRVGDSVGKPVAPHY